MKGCWWSRYTGFLPSRGEKGGKQRKPQGGFRGYLQEETCKRMLQAPSLLKRTKQSFEGARGGGRAIQLEWRSETKRN